jgi:hypothetical protein
MMGYLNELWKKKQFVNIAEEQKQRLEQRAEGLEKE